MSQFALGRVHLAQVAYRNALDLAAGHFPHESQRIEALACIAECQYYADDLTGARCNVDAALASLREQVAVDGPVFQVTYLTAAAVYARVAGLDEALSLLLEARAVAQYLQREHRLANIDIRRVEELTRAGYCADAEEIIQQDGFQRALAGQIGEPSCIPLLAMNAGLAVARFEIATQQQEAACRRNLVKVATFNINNINKRLDNLLAWLAKAEPDVVSLQELKAEQEAFPVNALRTLGYEAVWQGERSWNGVAILARNHVPVLTRTSLPGNSEGIILKLVIMNRRS